MASNNPTVNIRGEQRKIIRTFKGLENGQVDNTTPIVNDAEKIIGSLAAITVEMAADPSVIAALTRWRKRFMRFFLTQFEATETRTAAWLKNVVIKDDTRILFLILDEAGRAIGNYGVANITAKSAELDNMIRGERGGDSKLIFFSELALIRWMYLQLSVEEIYLRVFSNNPSISMHQTIGFSITHSWRLIKQETDDGTTYEVDFNLKPEEGELAVIRMSMSRSEFFEKYS